MVGELVIDMRADQDAEVVLENPGKGLFHHYYDNTTHAYPSSPQEIDAVPGCRNIYIRLPWSEFEPERGRFNWRLIDETVAKFLPKGYTFSLRITCKETGYAYATPEWVRLAGARGGFYKAAPDWGENAWEPEWDDPVFLKHLEAFLGELGRRYDGKEWLEFVDIGSIGDWGEGHTHFGSKKRVPPEVRRRHIDIYRKAFRHTPLAVIDDFCAYQTSDAEAQALFDYALANGILLRDDSIGVDWWLNEGAKASWSVARPAWFAAAWPSSPTIIELEHYHLMKKSGNWRGKDGCERGSDWLLKAMELCRPSWLGYHGWAKEWLDENPTLTRELANRVGYWLFPEEAKLPRSVRIGEKPTVAIRLFNRGWAPPYRVWNAAVRLSKGSTSRELSADCPHPRLCRPGESAELAIRVTIPPGLQPGDWLLLVRFSDRGRPVRFACKAHRQDADGWLKLGLVRIDR